jgi:DNA-binding beta-propeller fold protein YncE
MTKTEKIANWSLREVTLVVVVAIVGFASANSARFLVAPSLFQPVAIDKGSSSDVFVLDIQGTVHRLQQSGNSLTQVAAFHLPSSRQFVDMSYSVIDGQQSIFVVGVQLDRGYIWRYAIDGRSLDYWPLANIGAGITCNDATHSVYLATSNSNEIYHLDLDNRKLSYISQISGARKIGPLTIDPANQVLYVADIDAGVIYEHSIRTESTKRLASGFSAPSALYFDAPTGRLYVADAGLRKIVFVDTHAKKQVLTDFVSSPLKSPTGFALLSGGIAAVTDLRANQVYLFSSRGALLSHFPE